MKKTAFHISLMLLISQVTGIMDTNWLGINNAQAASTKLSNPTPSPEQYAAEISQYESANNPTSLATLLIGMNQASVQGLSPRYDNLFSSSTMSLALNTVLSINPTQFTAFIGYATRTQLQNIITTSSSMPSLLSATVAALSTTQFTSLVNSNLMQAGVNLLTLVLTHATTSQIQSISSFGNQFMIQAVNTLDDGQLATIVNNMSATQFGNIVNGEITAQNANVLTQILTLSLSNTAQQKLFSSFNYSNPILVNAMNQLIPTLNQTQLNGLVPNLPKIELHNVLSSLSTSTNTTQIINVLSAMTQAQIQNFGTNTNYQDSILSQASMITALNTMEKNTPTQLSSFIEKLSGQGFINMFQAMAANPSVITNMLQSASPTMMSALLNSNNLATMATTGDSQAIITLMGHLSTSQFAFLINRNLNQTGTGLLTLVLSNATTQQLQNITAFGNTFMINAVNALNADQLATVINNVSAAQFANIVNGEMTAQNTHALTQILTLSLSNPTQQKQFSSFNYNNPTLISAMNQLVPTLNQTQLNGLVPNLPKTELHNVLSSLITNNNTTQIASVLSAMTQTQIQNFGTNNNYQQSLFSQPAMITALSNLEQSAPTQLASFISNLPSQGFINMLQAMNANPTVLNSMIANATTDQLTALKNLLTSTNPITQKFSQQAALYLNSLVPEAQQTNTYTNVQFTDAVGKILINQTVLNNVVQTEENANNYQMLGLILSNTPQNILSGSTFPINQTLLNAIAFMTPQSYNTFMSNVGATQSTLIQTAWNNSITTFNNQITQEVAQNTPQALITTLTSSPTYLLNNITNAANFQQLPMVSALNTLATGTATEQQQFAKIVQNIPETALNSFVMASISNNYSALAMTTLETMTKLQRDALAPNIFLNSPQILNDIIASNNGPIINSVFNKIIPKHLFYTLVNALTNANFSSLISYEATHNHIPQLTRVFAHAKANAIQLINANVMAQTSAQIAIGKLPNTQFTSFINELNPTQLTTLLNSLPNGPYTYNAQNGTFYQNGVAVANPQQTIFPPDTMEATLSPHKQSNALPTFNKKQSDKNETTVNNIQKKPETTSIPTFNPKSSNSFKNQQIDTPHGIDAIPLPQQQRNMNIPTLPEPHKF